MTKEVFITIKGLHSSDSTQDKDNLELIIPGEYYYRNNKHFVCYEEVVEGATELSKSVIKLNDNMVELIKRGPGSTHMVFEKGKMNYTYYKTLMGDLFIGVDTKKLNFSVTEDKISANINYTLEMNEQKVSDCEVSIVIVSNKEMPLG